MSKDKPAEPVEELDLSIPNMQSAAEEARAAEVLRDLPGIESIRLVACGAWIAYRPATIAHGQICERLHAAGFRAATFQDSASGETGKSRV